VPVSSVASQLYTNFLSVGYNLFAITNDGQLYGSGLNSSGQLGNGAVVTSQSTPVKFQLPSGVLAKYVAQGMAFTYVIGSDDNVYSAGSCSSGALGYTYTISGCVNQSTYKRVALPTVNQSDLNTLPVATSDWVQSTNIATDRSNAFVRMEGGRVYGWGVNDRGQLGNGTYNDSSTPLQITMLGDSGQPKATQVAFDGESVWILDSSGDVWAAGYNNSGELGTASPVSSSSGKCIDNPNNSSTDGTALRILDCNNSTAQMLEWAENGSLIFRPDSLTVKCMDNANASTANGNAIRLWTCNGTIAQKWTMNNVGQIENGVAGKCLDNPGNTATSGTLLQLYDCSTAAGDVWSLNNRLTPGKVVLPSGHGKVARMTTDFASVMYLMTDGTVWGYGVNSTGQLGNGVLSRYNPKVQQYILPSGRTAINFYTTKMGEPTDIYFANTFVVLDDGSVYGSGANSFGQLGNGTTSLTPIPTPVKMTLPVGVRAQTVQTGLGSTVVLTDQGRIYTVGNNGNGQLGDGTTTNSSTPQARQYVNYRPIVLY
jgi:alpha-tubulin suppressor-like RCC1 family protein